MTTRAKIEFLGFILAGLGWLILLAQIGAWFRFGSFDPFFYQATLPGTLEQWCVLAYLVLILVLLSCRED